MRSNRRRVVAAVREELRRKNAQAGALVEAEAKRKCPVDQGILQASITHQADETGAVVGTNVNYGKFVELGTTHQNPQPFLVPALRESEDALRRLYGER